MSSKIVSDTEANELLDILHGSNTEAKIAKLQVVKANIKHMSVQNEAIGPLFEACRLGLTSSNGALFNHALSCIGHLIKRVSLQDQSKLRPQLKSTVPVLFDKCSDSRDRARGTVITAIVDFWKAFPAEIEKQIKDSAFVSRNPRIREACLLLIRKRHNDEKEKFSFRTFTPFIVQLLEDADPTVRDTAKDLVVELFKDAAGHAKADLKREMSNQMVRKAIASTIIAQLGIPEDVEETRSASRAGGHAAPGKKAPSSTGSTASSFLVSLPGYEMQPLDSVDVFTGRELDGIFEGLLPAFEGRESEQNWAARERNLTKIRQLIRGNAIRDYPQNFFAGIKLLMDGILKGTSSLRTTLSCNGMELVKDLSMLAGAGLDPTMVEYLLSTLVKLCAGTKKITAQTGYVTTATLLANVPFTSKVLHHVWLASQDKNVQPREYASGWIRVILESHIGQKGYMEHSGCVDLFEKCIKKGVTDANPKVRENMRVTYWKFAAIWPDRAAALLATLEGSNKTLLEKANPDGHRPASAAAVAAPTSRSASAPTTATRSSVKDAIMAKRKAMAQAQAEANLMPPPPTVPAAGASRPARPAVRSRPGTGMGTYSDTAVARAGSPMLARPSPRSNMRSPVPTPTSPPLLRTVRSTPIRQQQSPAVVRQPSLMEQLNSHDARVRLEGIITLKAVLSRKGAHDGQRLPALPPHDVLHASLAKLLNDDHPEVVEQVLAPELLNELEKAVPLEEIITKVLLHNEPEGVERASAIASSSLTALKKMLSESEAAPVLTKIMQDMGPAAAVPSRKAAASPYSLREKRRILLAGLRWFDEMMGRTLDGGSSEWLDKNSFRQYVPVFVSLFNKPSDPSYPLVAEILRKCERFNAERFWVFVDAFDAQTVSEVKAAMGQPSVDGASGDENAPGIDQVLAGAPRLAPHVLSEVNRPRDRLPNSSDPATPVSPRKKALFDAANTDEDLTMIQPVSALNSVPGMSSSVTSSEDKENKDVGPVARPTSLQLNSASEVALAEKPIPVNNGNDKTNLPTEIVVPQSKAASNAVRTLQSLVSRVKTREIDTVAFRRLISLAREHPVKSKGEEWEDIWDGGKTFDDLMSSLLGYLNDDHVNRDSNKTADLHAQAVLVIKQLLSKASFYFTKHESNVLITFIKIRGKHSSISSVTTGIIETCEELTEVADSASALPLIMDYLTQTENIPTQSKSMALLCMGALIKTATGSALERMLSRIGPLALKYLEDPDAEVRRACTSAIVELHVKIGNDRRMFEEILKGVNAGQQNLLVYYFAKKDAELKK